MVICPRCQQAVDETTRTDCPLCFTPISGPGAAEAAATATAMQAPAASGYAPPATSGGVTPLNGPAQTPGVMPLNGPAVVPVANPVPSAPLSAPMVAPTLAANQRMTLSGEVIEAPAPMSSQPPPGNSQYNSRPVSGGPRGKEVPQKSGGGGALVPILVLLVLGVVGFGSWYYWMHRTNPKDQAQKFYNAIKIMDAKAMYATMEVDGDKYKSEKEFVDDANASLDKNPAARQFITSMLSDLTFTAGAPKYTSMTEATVPVTTSGTMTMSLFGQTKAQSVNRTEDVKMKNFGGIWKFSKDNAGGLGKGMTGDGGAFGGLSAMGGGK